MNNVCTLRDINKRDIPTETGRRLGTAYEQELKEKLYSTLSSKAELRDLNGRLMTQRKRRLLIALGVILAS